MSPLLTAMLFSAAFAADGDGEGDLDLAITNSSLENQSDFQVGQVELRLRAAQVGTTPLPWSLITGLVGWSELAFDIDVGIAQKGNLCWSLGIEPWTAAPLLPTIFSAGGWKAAERGALVRVNAHFLQLSSVDAYIGGAAGPSLTDLTLTRTVDGVEGEATSRQVGGRIVATAGVSTVTRSRLLIGAELRYLVGWRFFRGSLPIEADDGSTIGEANLVGVQRAPRGFSWGVHAGVRF